MSRIEFGFVDLIGWKGDPGRLTWFRNARSRGVSFLTFQNEEGTVDVASPPSFVRAADRIADARRIERLWCVNEMGVRADVVGRTWRASVLGGELARGRVLSVFDTPHELAHAATVVCQTVNVEWLVGIENELQAGNSPMLIPGFEIESTSVSPV